MRRGGIVLAAALALAACGDGEPAADAGAGQRPAGGPSQASTAECTEWTAAGTAEREAIMRDLEQAFSRRGSDGERGETVPRDEGIEILDRACDQPFARNFRLWKLYERAVGFN